ncbi:MAG: SagB/ThcOx family dehydrogenase [Phycisphaerae bacterium]|nr:SagB/ThcOx family dehydrogenase [Phycisphaerae bacterium]
MTRIEANPDNIGQVFQEHTKYKYVATPSEMMRGRPLPAVEQPVPDGADIMTLPRDAAGDQEAEVFWRRVASRRSRRNFADEALELGELSTLLWATQGVLKMMDGHTMRTVPSAGARHPLETYVIVNRVESLAGGLYRYQPLEHQLVQLREDARLGFQAAMACLQQNMVALCGATFVWTAVIDRARWKYQQRGYRYIYLDAGHVCQNLYMACEFLHLNCCAIGAVDDDVMNELIGVDGREEFVIYLAVVGKRRGGG